MLPRAHAILLLLLVACSAHQPAETSLTPSATPPATPHPTSIFARIPEKVGSYTLTERAAVTGAPKDSLYRFTDGSSAIVTVFVFDVPPDVKVEADSQKWTFREGEKFKQVQDFKRQRGDFRDYTVAFADSARSVFGARRLLEHSIATAVRQNTGAMILDFQLLYLIDGRFLKVRATIPSAGWEQTTVMSFARSLARIVANP